MPNDRRARGGYRWRLEHLKLFADLSAKGLSARAIAEKLGLRPGAVRNVMARRGLFASRKMPRRK